MENPDQNPTQPKINNQSMDISPNPENQSTQPPSPELASAQPAQKPKKTLIKILLFLVIILFLAVLVFGYVYFNQIKQNQDTETKASPTPVAQAEEIDPAADWKSYIGEDGLRFTIQYPKDWYLNSNILTDYESKESYSKQNMIDVSKNRKFKCDFTIGEQNTLSKISDKREILSTNKIKILKGKTLPTNDPGGGNTISFIFKDNKEKNKPIALFCFSYDQDLESEFLEIIKTFKFIDNDTQEQNPNLSEELSDKVYKAFVSLNPDNVDVNSNVDLQSLISDILEIESQDIKSIVLKLKENDNYQNVNGYYYIVFEEPIDLNQEYSGDKLDLSEVGKLELAQEQFILDSDYCQSDDDCSLSNNFCTYGSFNQYRTYLSVWGCTERYDEDGVSYGMDNSAWDPKYAHNEEYDCIIKDIKYGGSQCINNTCKAIDKEVICAD